MIDKLKELKGNVKHCPKCNHLLKPYGGSKTPFVEEHYYYCKNCKTHYIVDLVEDMSTFRKEKLFKKREIKK